MYKKILRILISVMIGIIIGLLPTKFFTNYNIQETPKTIAKRYICPTDISNYLRVYYTYIGDTKQFDYPDYWQTSKEMIKNKQGDCEDFAILTQAILKELKIESQLIGVYAVTKNKAGVYGGYQHIVCVFQEEEKYCLMTNMYYSAYYADSLIDLMDAYIPNWYSIKIYKADKTVIETIKNENWIDPTEKKVVDNSEK